MLTIIVLGDNNAVIAGSVNGLFILCVIIGIILVLVFLKKRSRAKTSLVVRSGTVNVTCNLIIIINLL